MPFCYVFLLVFGSAGRLSYLIRNSSHRSPKCLLNFSVNKTNRTTLYYCWWPGNIQNLTCIVSFLVSFLKIFLVGYHWHDKRNFKIMCIAKHKLNQTHVILANAVPKLLLKSSPYFWVSEHIQFLINHQKLLGWRYLQYLQHPTLGLTHCKNKVCSMFVQYPDSWPIAGTSMHHVIK